MKRARCKTLPDGTRFGQIPGIAGVWAHERTLDRCQEVLQDVLGEWLVLKIRDHDGIDGSLVRKILRQAGIRLDDCRNA